MSNDFDIKMKHVIGKHKNEIEDLKTIIKNKENQMTAQLKEHNEIQEQNLINWKREQTMKEEERERHLRELTLDQRKRERELLDNMKIEIKNNNESNSNEFELWKRNFKIQLEKENNSYIHEL